MANVAEIVPSCSKIVLEDLMSPNMAVVVGAITSDSEKIEYDPENGTNWCHLPKEIRLECIKRMDFKTRIRMRRTSKIEKSYVDSEVYHFKEAIIQTPGVQRRRLKRPRDRRQFYVASNETIVTFQTPNFLTPFGVERVQTCFKKLLQLGPNPFGMLKLCEFEHLKYVVPGPMPFFVHDMAAIRFRNIRCCTDSFTEGVDFFLDHCYGGLENIKLYVGQYHAGSLFKLLKKRSFNKAKNVVVGGVRPEELQDGITKLLEIWSKQDVEIGTSCRLTSGRLDSVIGEEHVIWTDYFYMQNESKTAKVVMKKDASRRSDSRCEVTAVVIDQADVVEIPDEEEMEE